MDDLTNSLKTFKVKGLTGVKNRTTEEILIPAQWDSIYFNDNCFIQCYLTTGNFSGKSYFIHKDLTIEEMLNQKLIHTDTKSKIYKLMTVEENGEYKVLKIDEEGNYSLAFLCKIDSTTINNYFDYCIHFLMYITPNKGVGLCDLRTNKIVFESDKYNGIFSALSYTMYHNCDKNNDYIYSRNAFYKDISDNYFVLISKNGDNFLSLKDGTAKLLFPENSKYVIDDEKTFLSEYNQSSFKGKYPFIIKKDNKQALYDITTESFLLDFDEVEFSSLTTQYSKNLCLLVTNLKTNKLSLIDNSLTKALNGKEFEIIKNDADLKMLCIKDNSKYFLYQNYDFSKAVLTSEIPITDFFSNEMTVSTSFTKATYHKFYHIAFGNDLYKIYNDNFHVQLNGRFIKKVFYKSLKNQRRVFVLSDGSGFVFCRAVKNKDVFSGIKENEVESIIDELGENNLFEIAESDIKKITNEFILTTEDFKKFFFPVSVEAAKKRLLIEYYQTQMIDADKMKELSKELGLGLAFKNVEKKWNVIFKKIPKNEMKKYADNKDIVNAPIFKIWKD